MILDLSDRICLPNKTKDVNVKVINMIKRIIESKSSVKEIHVIILNVDLTVKM